jgi:ATP-dependent RNA helicase SUPV3L1/SUV3
VLPRGAVAGQLAALTADDRRALARLGIHLGRESIWLPGHGKPGPGELKRLLWAVHADQPAEPVPPARPLSYRPEPAPPEPCLLAQGYRLVAGLAIRVDALERLSKAAHLLARQGPFAATDALAALIGASLDDLGTTLSAIGYRPRVGDDGATFTSLRHRRKGRTAGGDQPSSRPRRPPRRRPAAGDSPFARLAQLRFGK